MVDTALSRRGLLAAAPAVGLAAMGLASCSAGPGPSGNGSPGDPATSAGRNIAEGSFLPTYQAVTGTQPDLSGDGFVVPDGYFHYPSGMSDLIDGPIGDGSKVSVMCGLDLSAPPGVNNNTYWQALNERIGSELEFQMVPDSDYRARFSTAIAGDQIGELTQIPVRHPGTPEIMDQLFTDLTEYLSGDAVLDYPFLANLPESAWLESVYNGKIYGVRYPLALYSNFMLARKDVLAEVGASVDDVTDAESFLDLCREVTDPKRNRWAVANANWHSWFVMEMLGHAFFPGQLEWQENDGKLIQGWETDEFRQAMTHTKKMIDEGLFHADTFALSGTQEIGEFNAGRLAFDYRGGAQWETRVAVDKVDVTAIPPVAFDGGGLGQKTLTKGVHTMTSIRKGTDPDRIRMLLRVMNFMAAPFGTNEFLLLKYGVEGEHFTRNASGDPEPTSKGKADVALPTKYIAQAPPWVYMPTGEDAAREYHGFIEQVAAVGYQDPTTGLWSDTDLSTRSVINTMVSDAINGFWRGEKTMADFDAAVDEWRAGGGDTARQEYEAAIAERAEQ